MLTLGTETREGYIPHLQVTTAGGVIRAPVKIVLRKTIINGGPAMAVDPVRQGDALVYALPGGGEIVA